MSDQSTSRRQPYDPEKTQWTAGDAKKNFASRRGNESKHDGAHDGTHAGTQRSVRRVGAPGPPPALASPRAGPGSRRTPKARVPR
ncbi:MAG: hypothetical protein R5N78_08900, partial [Cutibacterium granulosum]|uniref:hypothetical protein n=1 Tax=Cutibacterium granulosum TaxID=33011 RepID=UPI002B229E23